MAKVKTTRLGCNPNFLRDCVAIHNNLAAISKLDFEHASGSKIKIQIGPARLQALFDFFQRYARQRGEFSVIHPVLPSTFSRYQPMRSLIILAALLATSLLGACGTRGSLSQLPVPAQPPLLERWGPAPAPAKPAGQPAPAAETKNPADLNTAPEVAK